MLLVAFPRAGCCCSRVWSGQPVRRPAPLRVDRNAHEPTGQRGAMNSFTRREENAACGPPKPERHARIAARTRPPHRHPSRRGGTSRVRASRFGGHRERALPPSRGARITPEESRHAEPLAAGVLQQHPEAGPATDVIAVRVGQPPRLMPSGSARRCATTSMVCGQPVGVDEEHELRRGRRSTRVQQRHRLKPRRSPRRASTRFGDLHTGEVGDHRLEVHERFEPAPGRSPVGTGVVRGVPGRVFRGPLRRITGGVMVVSEVAEPRSTNVNTPRCASPRRRGVCASASDSESPSSRGASGSCSRMARGLLRHPPARRSDA